MCFSISMIESWLVWLIVVVAVVAFVKLVLPSILGVLGVGGGLVTGAINIILWAVVAIFTVYIFFDLLGCLLPHLHG